MDRRQDQCRGRASEEGRRRAEARRRPLPLAAAAGRPRRGKRACGRGEGRPPTRTASPNVYACHSPPSEPILKSPTCWCTSTAQSLPILQDDTYIFSANFMSLFGSAAPLICFYNRSTNCSAPMAYAMLVTKLKFILRLFTLNHSRACSSGGRGSRSG